MDKLYNMVFEIEIATFVGVMIFIVVLDIFFTIVALMTIVVNALYEHFITENHVAMIFLVICFVLAMFFYS